MITSVTDKICNKITIAILMSLLIIIRYRLAVLQEGYYLLIKMNNMLS